MDRAVNLRKTRSQRGVAVVELALVLPWLLLLMFTTTELGRAVHEYGKLTKAARQAVRYLSMQTPGQGTVSARNLVIYGNLQGTGRPILPGLTPAQVPEPVWTTEGAAPPVHMVTVRITGYQFESLLGSGWGHRFGSIRFGDVTAAMRSSQ